MRVVAPRLGAAVAAFVGWASLACHDDATECDCLAPGFTITVEPGGPEEAVMVIPSGPACADAGVTCETPTSLGCTAYRVVPTAEGDCHVDVYFSGGTDDSDDVNIVEETGCCSGFYPDPPSAGQVDLPPPGTPADAGRDA
jgi:hypothetical protein